MGQITENYIATGKVVYVFYQLPLTSIHPQAQITAEASECAGLQSKFWEMHDLIFEKQAEWSGKTDMLPILTGYATTLGLDVATFEACVVGNDTAPRIQADTVFANGLGITGTPFFVINHAGQLYAVSGAQPYDAFQQGLDGLLTSP